MGGVKKPRSGTPAKAGFFAASKEALGHVKDNPAESIRFAEIAQNLSCVREFCDKGISIKSEAIVDMVLGPNAGLSRAYKESLVVFIDKAIKIIEENKGDLKHRGDDPVKDYYMPIAMMVAGMGLDQRLDGEDKFLSVMSSLLYEIRARNLISFDEIKEQFGDRVAVLTEQLSRTTAVPITAYSYNRLGQWTVDHYLFNQKQYALAQDLLHYSDDPARVWIIKYAAALQRMRIAYADQKKEQNALIQNNLAEPSNIERLNKKRKEIGYILHVQGMYLPMAHEMGSPFFKEMQELILKTIDPHAERKINEKLCELGYKGRCGGEDLSKIVIDHVSLTIAELLKGSGYEVGVNCRIEARVKDPYSIWKKLLEKQNAQESKPKPTLRINDIDALFDTIYDVLAFRIVVDDPHEESCGTIYNSFVENLKNRSFNGRARSANSVINERHKNYIEEPKENGYKAIHDCFFVDGMPLELQIVTEEMHINNSGGLAGHAAHKLNRKKKNIQQNKLARRVGRYHPSPIPPTTDNPEKHALLVGTIVNNIFSLIHGGTETKYAERKHIVVYTQRPDGKGGALRAINMASDATNLCNSVHSTLSPDVYGMVVDGVVCVKESFVEEALKRLKNASQFIFLKAEDLVRNDIVRHTKGFPNLQT